MKSFLYPVLAIIAISLFACSPNRTSPEEAKEFVQLMAEKVSENENFIYDTFFAAVPEKTIENPAEESTKAFEKFSSLLSESIEDVYEEKTFEHEVDKPYSDKLKKETLDVLNLLTAAKDKELKEYQELIGKGALKGDVKLIRVMATFSSKLAKELDDLDKTQKEFLEFYHIDLK